MLNQDFLKNGKVTCHVPREQIYVMFKPFLTSVHFFLQTFGLQLYIEEN